MKAKKTKLGILAGLLAGCCFLTSCTSLYDVAPKAYAEWDGNYIYCANMRSKTTGEGEEYLIETLTKDGTDYTFNYARDYAYVGDDIYMCLDMKTTTQVENRYDYTTCFAVYNVQDKTSEVVLWGEDDLVIEYIYYMTTEYAVLRVHGGKYDSTLICVDFDGNIVYEDVDWALSYTCVGDYLVKYKDGAFVYSTWDNEAQNSMFRLDEDFRSFDATYYKDEKYEGFLIEVKGPYSFRYNSAHGLYFYDVVKKQTCTLIGYNKNVEFVKDGDYYVIGERQQITYENTVVMMGMIIPIITTEEYTYSGLHNCALLKINWSADILSMETVYDFSKEHEGKDFSSYWVLSNGDFYFETRELEIKVGGCTGKSGTVYSEYMLNGKTGVLQKTNSLTSDELDEATAEKQRAEAMEKGRVFDVYVYYIGWQSYGGIGTREAYTLYRFNMQTQTEEVMQFWAPELFYNEEEYDYIYSTDDWSIRVRHSLKMWLDYDEDYGNNFIVRDY